MSTVRFFLAQDISSHWFVVPEANRAEWEAWTAIDEDDERSWTAPGFAKPVNGSPSRITFEAPLDLK